MSRFQAGALVVYGNLGVHEVEGGRAAALLR